MFVQAQQVTNFHGIDGGFVKVVASVRTRRRSDGERSDQ